VNRQRTGALADRLALAIIEHGPLAGSDLAGRVGAQKSAVLRELRTNPMFAQSGRGSASRYGLVAADREPIGTDQEPTYGVASHDHDSDLTPDVRETLVAVEARLVAIERLLGLHPARTNGDVQRPGQVTVEDAIARAANGELPA
jgi:hypothetical protein